MPAFDLPQRPTTPHTTVVLAMSADGKITDIDRSPARFGSAVDKHHLETQIAQADAVLFGAGTLRTYGTTLSIHNPSLLKKRQQQGKPAQPIHIVCSGSANLDPHYFFFRQPVPRWLITAPEQMATWQQRPEFQQVLPLDALQPLPWTHTLHQLFVYGIRQLVVTGGGELVAALLAEDLLDEFWLTVCPLLLGGATAPSPVTGAGFPEALAPKLKLLEVKTIDQEVFLHYQRQRDKD